MCKQFLVLMLCTGVTVVYAQKLDVNRIELKDDKVLINYNLTDTVPGRNFTVNLYSSRDNYINPLSRIHGDHGLQVKAGNNKTLTWLAKQELSEDFQGSLSLEVRARVYIPFIEVDKIGTIKRGKQKEVTWRGGTRQNVLNFELYNSKDEKVHVIPNLSNSGHTSLFIPPDVKPGKDYKFKVVDSKNKDQVVYTEKFIIKRKLPLVIFAIPVAVVGGLVSFLGSSGGGGGGGSEIPPGASEITGPPDPPN